MKRITIKDIASLLNISPSTVSRALADHPDISQPTKDRVREVARSLNYTPNLKARYLRSQLSGLIVLLLPEINMFFTPALMNGINEIVDEKGYSLVILQSDNSVTKEANMVKYCVNLGAEGVLLSLSTETSDLGHLQIARDADIPVVLLDKTIDSESYSSISIDGSEASFQAVSYLLKKGRTKIAGIFGNPRMSISQERKTGYNRALEAHGNPNNFSLDVEKVEQFETYWQQFTKQHPDFDACFTMSDELLVRTHHALNAMGRRIPEDVALFSISDGQAPYYLFPKVSHLKHSGYEVGKSAAKLLFNLIGDLNSTNMTLDAKLPIQLVELNSV